MEKLVPLERVQQWTAEQVMETSIPQVMLGLSRQTNFSGAGRLPFTSRRSFVPKISSQDRILQRTVEHVSRCSGDADRRTGGGCADIVFQDRIQQRTLMPISDIPVPQVGFLQGPGSTAFFFLLEMGREHARSARGEHGQCGVHGIIKKTLLNEKSSINQVTKHADETVPSSNSSLYYKSPLHCRIESLCPHERGARQGPRRDREREAAGPKNTAPEESHALAVCLNKPHGNHRHFSQNDANQKKVQAWVVVACCLMDQGGGGDLIWSIHGASGWMMELAIRLLRVWAEGSVSATFGLPRHPAACLVAPSRSCSRRMCCRPGSQHMRGSST